jgi:uncharacterized protein YicC (UPF0701 family)
MDSKNDNNKSLLNSPLINTYIDQLRSIVDGSAVELLKIAVKMPDAIISKQIEENDSDWPKIFKEIENAIESLIKYRKDEGLALEKDFIMRIHKIGDLLSLINEIDPGAAISAKHDATSQKDWRKVLKLAQLTFGG